MDVINASVFDEAISELRHRSQVKLYQTDFDAWAWDVLRMRNYEKIRQIAHDSLFGDKERTLTKSGNGVGKSALMSQMILWAGTVFPVGSTVSIVSAPSIPQLQKTVFAYLKSYHGRVSDSLKLTDFKVPGWIDESLGWVANGPDGKIWLASGRKPPDQDAVSMFQGLRSQIGMTYVWFDEAGGMPKAMFTAAEAVMTGDDSRFSGIGNPDNASAEWRENFSEPEKMAEYNLHTISVYDTPVFTGERVYPHTAEGDRMEKQLMKALTSKRWVAHKSRIWATGGEVVPDFDRMRDGKPDPRYFHRVPKTEPFTVGDPLQLGKPLIEVDGVKRVVIDDIKWDARGLSKVLGEFPGDNDYAFFPQDAITASRAHEIPEDMSIRPILGVDIARFGPDESVVYINRGGRVRLNATWGKEDTVFTARRIHKIAQDTNASQVRVDASGIGGSVFDMLKQLDEFKAKTYDLIGIDGGYRSSDNRRWANTRAENHDNLRTLMVMGALDLDYDDEELKNQLTNTTFKFTNRGAVQITPKDEMRTEMDGSPDRLDALIYSVADVSSLFKPPDALEPGDIVVQDPWEMSGAWYAGERYPL
jgi:hypothetical protein